jgi:DNA invertase Pin-like site-specific DNA recombinase
MASKTVRAAAIYCRLSQDRTGSSLGIDRQEDLCRDRAELLGWPVAEVYVDRDISAYSGKRRPSFERMLDDVKNHRRDAVIVVDQDRLTRTPRELESFIDLADSCDILLASVSGEVDLATSDGRFSARIMGVVARQESEKKSERQKRQRAQAAQLGSYQGGRRAFGYESDGVTVRKAEAKLIREAARRVIRGESLRQIVLDWNARGIPAVSSGQWVVTSLRSMITGPRLAGLRVHRGEVVGDAVWPAILDRATHEKMRAIIGDPRRTQGGRPARYLLAGILRCGRCGAKMNTSRRQDGDRRYMCSPAPQGCGRTAIKAEPLDGLIADTVLHAIDTPKLARQLSKPRKGDDDAVIDLEQIERDLDFLATRFGEGRMTQREYVAALAPLERRRDDALRGLNATADNVALEAFRGVDVRKAWAKLNVERRRAALSALIDRITIGPGTPGRRAFDPDRVHIDWRA